MKATATATATTTIKSIYKDTLCPYREWTGNDLPRSLEELIEEYERLCAPTFPEYGEAKTQAREAVWKALEKFRA